MSTTKNCRAKHHPDQLAMYAKFGCKPTWLEPKDVDKNPEAKTVLRY